MEVDAGESESECTYNDGFERNEPGGSVRLLSRGGMVRSGTPSGIPRGKKPATLLIL
ncbi:unnamed protein product [Strongylus vulgaris]|uniref:Uncharacterized protein n=1 Tax=Strongylus vulgaris TaxID=40348 RepID=A0A3P7IHX4_STRVU|nr:unnamed protein product [Strongylus vulgaris]